MKKKTAFTIFIIIFERNSKEISEAIIRFGFSEAISRTFSDRIPGGISKKPIKDFFEKKKNLLEFS